MSWFKRKFTEEKQPEKSLPKSLNDYNFCYLYRFTREPSRTSADLASFARLYSIVIGGSGGMILSRSYHPFQLINPKATSVWIAAFTYLFTRNDIENLFRKTAQENASCQALKFFMADPTFVIGFDEFDDQHPGGMVDHFVNYLSHLR
ncbi:MAG: hypothetical protein ABW174_09400 [Flavitalea sp.]